LSAFNGIAPSAEFTRFVTERRMVHEIKHDGYGLIARRDGETARLFTRRGYDWTERYPAITRVAARLRARTFHSDCISLLGAALHGRQDHVHSAYFDRGGGLHSVLLRQFQG
jgi:hypothetical protein